MTYQEQIEADRKLREKEGDDKVVILIQQQVNNAIKEGARSVDINFLGTVENEYLSSPVSANFQHGSLYDWVNGNHALRAQIQLWLETGNKLTRKEIRTFLYR